MADGDLATDEICVFVPAGAVSPKADVYFLADTTGSMGSILASLRANANSIVGDLFDDLGSAGLDLRIGVGQYKDFPFDVFAFDHQVDPVSEADEMQVMNAINDWTAGGGSDGSEGQFFALDRLANDIDPDAGTPGTIGWRSDAKKIIVWFGDAPAHDPVCSAISGLTSNITEASVTGALVAGDYTVVAIGTNTGFPNDLNDNPTVSAADYTSSCGPAGGTSGQATRITDATGGSYFTGIDAMTITDTIVMAVEDEVGTVASLGVEPGAGLAPYISSIDPPVLNIPTGEDATFCFDVNWVGVCEDEERVVSETIEAVADGVSVGSTAVTLTLEPCCPTVDGDLGSANPFNVFVFDDLEVQNADIGGRVAVGGNATVRNYGLASTLSDLGVNLSVGGNFDVINGQLFSGSGEVAGGCTVVSFGTPAGMLTCNLPSTFNASDHQTEMLAISSYLADEPSNGTTSTEPWGGVFLTASNPELNIFTLDLDNLGFAPSVPAGEINRFDVSVPAGSTVVVNVLGDTAPLFKNGAFFLDGASNSRIIWNFQTQTSLEISGVSVPGTILAPLAMVTHNNGNLDGTLVAKSAGGGGEFHRFEFDGNICPE